MSPYSRYCCILFLDPLSSWEITRLRTEFPGLKSTNHQDAINREFSFSAETQGAKQDSEAKIKQRINRAISSRNMMMLMSMAHCDNTGTSR